MNNHLLNMRKAQIMAVLVAVSFLVIHIGLLLLFRHYEIIPIGNELYRKFKDKGVTKVLTIEASGIAVACSVARLLEVPVLFAKKSQSLNIGNEVFTSTVSSYTRGKEFQITVSKRYLNPSDKVLLVDDFLAMGNAMKGLIYICKQANSSIAGIGICIEKGFQPGGEELRGMGYEVISLAIIDSMSEDGTISFRH